MAEFVNGPGCLQTDTVHVEGCPIPKVDIPNALTVNGNGANETFYIDKIRFYPENTLRIYNRWGSLVYEAYGYNNEWAGTRDGELLPVGTYYYVLDLGDGAGSSYEGYITLLRP